MRNVLWCVCLLNVALLRGQTYQFYFGNLHAHTGFSDGNKDSASSGVSVPAGCYAYAKLSDDFDFLGISEHNHFSANKNPGFKRAYYQTGLTMADAANQDGVFSCLFGMEYGVSSQYNGHVLIYGFDRLIGWEHSTPGDPQPNYDLYNAKTDYEGLFRKINQRPGAFAYLAHPDFDDFSTDGTYETALANAPYNAAFDSAIVGMPLRSGIASSNASNYNDYSIGNYFNYYKKMLYQGYHLGIGYDHDNHYTNFGRGNGGRLVILAPSLSRDNIYAAMKNMHFYGSDDANVNIHFRLNGQLMGSVCSGSLWPEIELLHEDPDGEHADTLRLWKGYKQSGGLWAWTVKQVVGSDVLMFTDTYVQDQIEYYYFAEIRQKDGQWIVTSPIWYRRASGTVLEEPMSATPRYLVYPNPVNDRVFVYVEAARGFTLRLSDVCGKCMFETASQGETLSVDVSRIPAGVYYFVLQNETVSHRQKICIVH